MLRKLSLCFLVVLTSLNFSGCVFLLIPAAIGVVGGVGIGIGTAKWLSDKLVEQVPVPYEKTVDGVRDGLKDLQLEITKQTATDNLTQINSKYSDGRTVWVNVVHVSASVSRIEVRVGVWGGQKEARTILDKILAHV